MKEYRWWRFIWCLKNLGYKHPNTQRALYHCYFGYYWQHFGRKLHYSNRRRWRVLRKLFRIKGLRKW